ncbi:MAG: NAD(P)/FAD-dependent oxidoreductase [Dehalococcoidia bacterium]|nr:NAD(P)/FAD-dependent oxidoreductase [Dehalococcoidia bacterium]
MDIVIVGNGIAGNAVASAIRKRDRQSNVTIVSKENFQEYDPCSLPYYVSGDVLREMVFRKSWEDYEREQVNLVLGEKVETIEPSRKTITTDKRTALKYDKLVLAQGGKAIVPPIKNVDMKGVMGCKLLGEADDLAAHKGKTAVVIGSGPIGIESAEALVKNGYQVYMVELLEWIMPMLFDERPARQLEEALNNYGIRVLTGEKVLSVTGDSEVSGVVTNKREIQCDAVVLATGVMPSMDIAKTAGIETARGIKVDERMMTSVEDIYACGDCVETVDAITGEPALYLLKHNAIEQAEVVARNCLGDICAYAGAWSFARVHYFDTHAVSIGQSSKAAGESADIEIIERELGEDYLRLILREGKLVGAQAIGKIANYAGILLGTMWRQDDLSKLRANWDKVLQVNYATPWPHRTVGRLMGLSTLGSGKDTRE